MDSSTRTRFSALWILVLIFAGIAGWLWYDQGKTTLSVNGEATVKAAPDEYIFSPSYQVKDANQTTAKSKVTETGNAVIAKLKELGLTDSMLVTNVYVNEDYDYRVMPTTDGKPTPDGYVATYTVTATVNDLELAKKVQEYLATTDVTGPVTPTSTFSDETQRKLEREARRLALEDAKQQANDTASTLGVSIRGIESIGEPSWGGPVIPLGIAEDRAASTMVAPESARPELLVGEQDVTFQIQVVYRVR